ncbi:sialidase family protein [Flavihumibacter solisilvae]|uniref:exo-alpha-sialidase n=1 Tax=Flavihumibacter solisilvae TaxID=1349421 RepID=A0A0C1KZC1_9BACT|nr:sialidase family protein [Flavihumibacter solisilvae]KIC93027.1 exo-alpha-sialidase [Flavihumibacter solisilvae]
MRITALSIIVACLVTVSCKSTKNSTAPDAEGHTIVFEPDSTYKSTRIPALVITPKNTLLAFCEGRIGTASDWADMNLAMRRSTDGGSNWEPIKILDTKKGAPVGNPTPIVDNKGIVHLLYQKDYNEAFYTYSEDDGVTWKPSVNITEVFNRFRPEYNWNVLAPGPGHGIQLKNGRLLASVWLANSVKTVPRRSHGPSCVATVYSDDGGKTWNRGSIIADSSAAISNPNESMPVQLEDGTILMSIRNPGKMKRRAFSTSTDGTSNWSGVRYAEELFDPTCMASIAAIPAGKKSRSAILFVNPDSRNIEKHPRKNLTAKLSYDGGKTWTVQKVLNSGASGYSDLAVGSDGTIYCLFETNTVATGWNYSLVLKKFNSNWITK